MCRRVLFFTSVIVVIFLVNSVFAGNAGFPAYGMPEVWWSDQDGNDYLWSSNLNWVHYDNYDENEELLDGHEPNESTVVYIGMGVMEVDHYPMILNTYDMNAPVIDSNTAAVCYAIWGPCGGGLDETFHRELDITGGSLDIGTGLSDFSARWEIAGTEGSGTVNISGGVVNVFSDLVVGNWGGTADINMTGGEINVGWVLCLPGVDEGSDDAVGTLKLHGGTVRCSGLTMNEWAIFPADYDWASEWMSISKRVPFESIKGMSKIDFEEGELIIDGDLREAIGNYISEERITVYDVNEGEIAPDGRRAYVSVYYNASEDTTTVTGDTADMELAYKPDPANYSKDVPVNVVLGWLPGDGALSHHVYLGTSFEDVNDADTSDTSNIYRGEVDDSNSYSPPEDLTMLGTYYWRIDEDDGVTEWKGMVWKFTVSNYRVVDNFDTYNSNTTLRATWPDGWTNLTGAIIKLEEWDPNFILSGKSMIYGYANNWDEAGFYSEISATTDALGIGSDLTAGDTVASLSLWFFGQADNVVEQMYVALEDSDTVVVSVYGGDMGEDVNDVKLEKWQEWNISLQEFADGEVDITNVAKIYIGFGDRDYPEPGGKGDVYFEDIKLYETRCVPAYSRTQGDFTGDCEVLMEDVGIMGRDWLTGDYDLPAAEPSPDGLVAHYEFEEGDARDSSGNNLHGTLVGDAQTVYDTERGNVLLLDGAGDYVNCGVDPMFDITGSITLACWTKVNDFDKMWQALVTRGDNSWRIARAGAKDWMEFALNYLSVPWIPGTTEVDDGQWYHVAAVYEHNLRMSLYINGVLDSDSETAGDINISEHDVCIGCNFGDPDSLREWDGWVDDVRIYSRALSQAELLYLATDGTGLMYMPADSPANIYDEEPKYQKRVNMRDFGIMADNWLELVLFP